MSAGSTEQPIGEFDDTWTYSRYSQATAAYHHNDRWTVRYTVTAKASTNYLLAYSQTGEGGTTTQAVQRWSLSTNFQNRASSDRALQEFEWYKWPLVEGKTWKTAWFQPAIGGNGDWTARVIGWETITVPAGTFQAIRIELDNSCYVTGVDGGVCGQQDRVWYAPEVKRHVKLERRSNRGPYMGVNILEELVEFRLK
jgi:hypothetical protein